MKTSKLLVFLVSSFLCVRSATTFAQQSSSPPPQRDPQATILLQKAIAAMGGPSAAQIQDTLTEATIASPQNPAAPATTTVIKTKGPDRIRIDNQSNGSSPKTQRVGAG